MSVIRRRYWRRADYTPFRHIDPTLVWMSLYAALNLGLALYFVRFTEHGDWALWASLPAALADGDLYRHDPTLPLPFVWSPVAGWLMAAITFMGYPAWAVLHAAAIFLLPDRRLILLTFLSWPFWHDVAEGNTMTFVFVAGALALRGSRRSSVAYLALCLLIPRPIQAPLAIWLLWKEPSTRLPFIGLFGIHAVAVIASGYAADWVSAMTSYGIEGPALAIHSIGPPRWFGSAWLLIGIPLGLWLTMRGRLGLAGLSVSPYWLPIYLLVGLWEVIISRGKADSRQREARDRLPVARAPRGD
jgi:hypothetical protein